MSVRSSVISGVLVVLSLNAAISSREHPRERQQECGRSKVTGDRIFGGREADIGAWPWLAALYLERGGEKYLECGGALISNRHVVTASHCLHDANKGTTTSAEEISVRLGDHDLNSLDDKTEPVVIDVSRIIRHPENDAKTFHNDIAILVLKDEVRFNQFVQPICLPYDPPMHTENYEGRGAYVAGWGSLSFDPPNSTLTDVFTPIWNHTKCREAYTRYISLNEDYMCAGFAEGGKDFCQGDGGCPLMLSGGPDSRFHLVGVVSFGKGCGLPNFPVVYTNVRRYLDWITASIS